MATSNSQFIAHLVEQPLWGMHFSNFNGSNAATRRTFVIFARIDFSVILGPKA
jgi:hypothetical protein